MKRNISVKYVGVDIHERESQIAIFDPSESLLWEKRMLTKNLETFIDSLSRENMLQ